MDKRLFTVKEAAAYMALTPITLYHWISKRQIPFVKLRSKAVRIDKAVIDKWIDSQAVKSGKEAAHDGALQARQDLVANLLP